jgi:hypothetical protein
MEPRVQFCESGEHVEVPVAKRVQLSQQHSLKSLALNRPSIQLSDSELARPVPFEMFKRGALKLEAESYYFSASVFLRDRIFLMVHRK